LLITERARCSVTVHTLPLNTTLYKIKIVGIYKLVTDNVFRFHVWDWRRP